MLPPDVETSPPEIIVPPIPQNRPVQDRARAERMERQRKELVGNYEKFGRKNPRWDAAAQEALTAFAHFQVYPIYNESAETWGVEQNRLELIGDDQIIAWKAARRALDAGCNDPLIQHIYARLSEGERMVERESRVRIRQAASEGMRVCHYPALLRAEALASTAEDLAILNYNRQPYLPEAERLIDEALNLIPEVHDTRENADVTRALFHLALMIVDACYHLPRKGEDRVGALERAYQRVTIPMDRDRRNKLPLLLLTANVQCRLAWLLRGRGTAPEVSDDGWDKFSSAMNKAEEALAEAREMDPTCVEIPRLMICLATYQDWSRERMELWFDRAMNLDGDDYFACLAKLEYLDPRWHGSEAEMLAFGRACLRTENWDARLPFILIEAHRRFSRNSFVQGMSAPLEGEYLSRPYVWSDVQAVYGPYLAGHPRSHYDKSCYARLAALGGHYPLANKLFDELGNDWWRTAFHAEEYDWLRRAAQAGKAGPRPHTRRTDRPIAGHRSETSSPGPDKR
jgi:tetratricopeptide (TPR) repeat protein